MTTRRFGRVPAACSRVEVSTSSAKPRTVWPHCAWWKRCGPRSSCWMSTCRTSMVSRSRDAWPSSMHRRSSCSPRVATTTRRSSRAALRTHSCARTLSRRRRSQRRWLADLREAGDLCARFLAMRGCVRSVVEAPEILEDVVLATDRLAVVRHEHRDLVRPDVLSHLLALLGVGRNLAGPEIEAELRQPLSDLVAVRAPFRLVELHESRFSRARVTQTR